MNQESSKVTGWRVDTVRDFRNFQTVVMLKRFLILGVLLHVTCVPSELFGYGSGYQISVDSDLTWENNYGQIIGGKITLDVEATDSFENIRQKIQDKTGIAPIYQTIVFGGQSMLDPLGILADFNIGREGHGNLYLNTSADAFLNATSYNLNPNTSIPEYTLLNEYDVQLGHVNRFVKSVLTNTTVAEDTNGVIQPISLSGTLLFSPAEQNSYTFNVFLANPTSSLSNFSDATGFTVPLVITSQGIIGFNSADVTVNVDTSSFSNNLGGGSFSLVQPNSRTLSLQFTPGAIPEPSTYGFCGVGAIGLMFFLRRKKSNQS